MRPHISNLLKADRRLPVWLIRCLLALGMTALFSLGVQNWRVRAQTSRFVSTSGNDQGGGNDCSSGGQPCKTIQNAINHSGGGDEISLGPGTYVENLIVSQSVTIRGDSATGSTVDGNHGGSVFIINNGVSATLETLTIQNGNAQQVTQVDGGGICNNGNLTVMGCTITGNQALVPIGDVISNVGGGGGIYNSGDLRLINSTVTRNRASNDAGGLDNRLTATLINSTIASNGCFVGADGVANKNDLATAVLNMTNTIIFELGVNYDNFLIFDHVGGHLGINSHNFVGRGEIPSALTGDPLLGPLQNNGGPTATCAVLFGSPAIDAGDDSVLSGPLNLTTDQRGFPRKSCAHVDIGAYEAGTDDPPIITCGRSIFATIDPGKLTATESLSVTAGGGCGSPLPVVFKLDDTVITSPYAFPLGVSRVFASATDSQGRTVTCDFFVFVRCVKATINCPPDITVFTDPGKTTSLVSFAATASDPCNDSLIPRYDTGSLQAGNFQVIRSPFAFPVGTTTVRASVHNGAGESSCAFNVTVICAPPIVTCPGNIAAYNDPGKPTGTVSFAATASDPCDGGLTPVYKIGNTVITSPYAFAPGVTTVTATATGSNGLTGSCSFSVTVTVLNACIQDNHTGDTFRFNSTTGQYAYTRCADKFTMTGTGSVRNVNGLNTLSDSGSDRRISAMFNPGSLTGRATIMLIPAPGVYQTIVVNQTNPSATCACP